MQETNNSTIIKCEIVPTSLEGHGDHDSILAQTKLFWGGALMEMQRPNGYLEALEALGGVHGAVLRSFRTRKADLTDPLNFSSWVLFAILGRVRTCKFALKVSAPFQAAGFSGGTPGSYRIQDSRL